MTAEAFAKALAAFQADPPEISKGQTAKVPTKSGGEYSYTYADLADILKAASPKLAAQGLSWSSVTAITDSGFILRSSLLHEEGHREDAEFPLPDPAHSSMQQIGSALTYARRYTFLALTGLHPAGEDDDGQNAADARASDRAERATYRHPPSSTARKSRGAAHDEDQWAAGSDARTTLINSIYAKGRETGVFAKEAFTARYGGELKDATDETLTEFLSLLTTGEIGGAA